MDSDGTSLSAMPGVILELAVGMKLRDIMHPDDRDKGTAVLKKVFQTGEAGGYEGRYLHPDGHLTWWETHIGPVKRDNQVVEAILITTQVTERVHAEEAIRESEELFRSIYADSPIAIMRFDADGKLIDVNRACLTMWDVSKVEDSRWSSIFAPDQFSSDKAKEQLLKGEVVRGEIELGNNKAAEMGYCGGTRADTVHMYILASPLDVSEGGTPKGYIVQIQDITAIRQSERALRDFSRRLVDVQEVERRHLARERHDQIGQTLTEIRLLLEMATLESGEKTRARLHEGQAAIKYLITRVGNLSLDLRPSMLDDLGLMPSLLWHFEHYTSQAGIRVIFEHYKGQERRFPSEVETAAYPIVQEALTNVTGHARVQAARVRLVIERDMLTVQIQDQGSGFDPEVALTGGSSGLLGMRERANSLGGQLIISSEHRRGTDLVAELPLEVNSDNQLKQDAR
ncbi:MAG: PAS domain S-box protein [Chloroflexi bacterium]|nr:PAS domain S-box protein [Chloroflexota bacterium]